MQDWLQQEVLRRLIAQTQCLLTQHAHALLVKPDGLEIADEVLQAIPSVQRWTVIDASSLIQQKPDPSYDMVFWLLLPHAIEAQQLVWQQLSCVAQDGAVLFFAAWSVDTWREWRDLLPELPFQDMHNIGDGLAQAGWCDAVMSSQIMQVTYHENESVSNDAQVLAVPPAIHEVISEGNPLTLSYEMAFGHAVFSMQARARQLGEYEVSVDQLRRH